MRIDAHQHYWKIDRGGLWMDNTGTARFDIVITYRMIWYRILSNST